MVCGKSRLVSEKVTTGSIWQKRSSSHCSYNSDPLVRVSEICRLQISVRSFSLSCIDRKYPLTQQTLCSTPVDSLPYQCGSMCLNLVRPMCSNLIRPMWSNLIRPMCLNLVRPMCLDLIRPMCTNLVRPMCLNLIRFMCTNLTRPTCTNLMRPCRPWEGWLGWNS